MHYEASVLVFRVSKSSLLRKCFLPHGLEEEVGHLLTVANRTGSIAEGPSAGHSLPLIGSLLRLQQSIDLPIERRSSINNSSLSPVDVFVGIVAVTATRWQLSI